jgi:predicted RNase H-like HicB family nuclease
MFRIVHALRAGARGAAIEWKAVKSTADGQTISTRIAFNVEVEQDTLDGGYIAACLDLPGCVSQGETEQEAVENLVEAIVGVMEARMQRHLRKRPLHTPEEEVALPPTHRHTLEIPVT